jgi:hypothetical protein
MPIGIEFLNFRKIIEIAAREFLSAERTIFDLSPVSASGRE